MGESVIADFVAFVDDAAQQIRIRLAVLADDEKRRRHIFLLQDVENRRCPVRIRAIVKSQRDQSRMIAAALNDVRRRRARQTVRDLMKPLAASTSRLRQPSCGRDTTFSISPCLRNRPGNRSRFCCRTSGELVATTLPSMDQTEGSSEPNRQIAKPAGL